LPRGGIDADDHPKHGANGEYQIIHGKSYAVGFVDTLRVLQRIRSLALVDGWFGSWSKARRSDFAEQQVQYPFDAFFSPVKSIWWLPW